MPQSRAAMFRHGISLLNRAFLFAAAFAAAAASQVCDRDSTSLFQARLGQGSLKSHAGLDQGANALALLSCSEGIGKSTWESLLAMDAVTHEVSSTPYVLSVVAEGGVSGDVVSEGQGYGVLTAGLALMSMNEGDAHYETAKRKFEGYFNGWRKMSRNSAGPCQSKKYCDGETKPCLPGWKHSADLQEEIGTGSAPDGDEDAIVGMIIALSAVKSDSVAASWYDEVYAWADSSCTQFLMDNTRPSDSGSHRLLKLGECWGGWNSEGNNPSCHAPGHYRMMRDFQASVTDRSYALPSDVSPDSWNKLIDTSYKFLATAQCPDTGLVPNWALVKEVDSQSLATSPGSFSGSGTPQYEFGAEASRTMWRVAFDAVAYPQESAAQSRAFLAPLQENLVANFLGVPAADSQLVLESFGVGSLQACPPKVSNVFHAWEFNPFIYAPVLSALAAGISEDRFTSEHFVQQDMVDAACGVLDGSAAPSYYSLSWQVIAQMTLNGEVGRAGALVAGRTSAPSPAPSPSPTPAPTPLPEPAPLPLPTPAPTPLPEPAPLPLPEPAPSPSPAPQGCFSNNYRDCNHPDFQSEGHSCTTVWLPSGAQAGCRALWEECGSTTSGCCAPAVCHLSDTYGQCAPPPTPPTACIACDDRVPDAMVKKGKGCTDLSKGFIRKRWCKDPVASRKKWCQLSCYKAGYGYDGDVCCVEEPSPTPTPATAPSPVPTPPQARGCCSLDYKTCNAALQGWCSETKENCMESCGDDKLWLANGEDTSGCIARWESCTSDGDCCGPAECQEGKCSADGGVSPTPATAPSPVPTPPQARGCCSLDYKTCNPTLQGWCSETEDNCIGPCDKFWLTNGEDTSGCIARWDTDHSCTSDSDCCGPAKCEQSQGHGTCE